MELTLRVVNAPSQWEVTLHCDVVSHWLGTCPANERRRYIVASSRIGWAHTQNDPWTLIVLAVWNYHCVSQVHSIICGRPFQQKYPSVMIFHVFYQCLWYVYLSQSVHNDLCLLINPQTTRYFFFKIVFHFLILFNMNVIFWSELGPVHAR